MRTTKLSPRDRVTVERILAPAAVEARVLRAFAQRFVDQYVKSPQFLDLLRAMARAEFERIHNTE